MEKPSLAVCTASGRMPAWPYTFSISRLLTELNGAFSRATYQVELGYATDMARSRLISYARREGYSHTLFVDDDMSFPGNAAARLLSHGKTIAAANYTSRVFPVVPLAGKGLQRVFSVGKTGLEQVDFAPTGLMLIDNSVFDNLPKPWFQTTFQPETPEDFMSDDVWFCNLARKHGFEVWLDHDLSQEVGHVGVLEYHHGLTSPPAANKSVVDLAKEQVGA